MKNKGFTIPELMLTFSVLVIVLGISFGDVSKLITATDEKDEEVAMKEIQRAMQAYLEDMGRLPEQDGNTLGSGTINWAQDLAGYTNLSEDQMMFDVWFNPRHYKMTSQTEVFRDTTFNTFYGIVYSYGADGMIDTDATLGTLEDPNVVIIPDRTLPLIDFAGDATDMPTYLAFDAGDQVGDDQFFKITDRQEKMANYEVTAKRISAIASALQSYGLAQMNFAISASETGWVDKIFYPPSDEQDPGVAPDLALYGENVNADTDLFLGGVSATVDISGGTVIDDANRRADMVALMRMLGLPDSYCCSAMELGADNLPNPFYYFSNPRRKLGGGNCGPRGQFPSLDIMLPPRLVVDATDPDTCG
jgi:type II secretory pathway pseudopilin PulG